MNVFLHAQLLFYLFFTCTTKSEILESIWISDYQIIESNQIWQIFMFISLVLNISYSYAREIIIDNQLMSRVHIAIVFLCMFEWTHYEFTNFIFTLLLLIRYMNVTNELNPEQSNTILATGKIVDLGFRILILKTYKHNIRFWILLSHFFFLSSLSSLLFQRIPNRHSIVSNAISHCRVAESVQFRIWWNNTYSNISLE